MSESKVINALSNQSGKVQSATQTAAGISSKAAGTAAIIQVAGQIIALGINAASTIKDQKLRREFEGQLANLSFEEQKAISEKVLAAQTDNDKRNIIAQTLLELAKKRIEEANKVSPLWYILGGVVVLGIGYFIYKSVNK
jgi:hypothetical protein